MADLDKKIIKIEKNCYEVARKELKLLKEENNNISSEKKLEKVNLYKDELSEKYQSELNKINREYNKNIFDYEMSERIKINKFKETLISNIKVKVEYQIRKIVDSVEYERYLFKCIQNTLKKVRDDIRNCVVYITEKDYYKFKDELINMGIKVDIIDNENIGGCVVVDKTNKVSIDNTLKTNIEEQIEKINFWEY